MFIWPLFIEKKLSAKNVAQHERREQYEQDYNADSDIELRLARALFDLNIFRAWETSDKAFGKPLYDGECQHRCGNFVHWFDQEVGAEHSL